MRNLAQHGTYALLLLSAFAACGKARQADDASSDEAGSHSRAGSGGAAVAGSSQSGSRAAGSGSEATDCLPLPCPEAAPWNAQMCACDPGNRNLDACNVDSDCTLVGRGCCHCGPPSQETSIAVHRNRAHEVIAAECPPGQPVCSCPALLQHRDPLAPVLHAACVEHTCAAVDLRTLELSTCMRDSDCFAEGLGCCGANSDNPIDYVGVNKGADDGILRCFPTPSCVPVANQPLVPQSFCANDGHCAVRKHEKASGLPSTACFSPDQNLDHAFDAAAIGCDCGSNEPAVCRKDSQGRYVGFICDVAKGWQAVNDGPCGKKP